MKLLSQFKNRRPNPFGLVALLLIACAYGFTLAPSITWSNGGTDSGELAAAVASAGIAHPPGYPTFVIVGIIWTRLLGFIEVALALNWLSALSSVLAAACLLSLTRRYSPATAAPISVIWGALLFALAPLVWSQAILTEVYGLGVAFFALSTLAVVALLQQPRPMRAFWCGLAFGLGFGALPQIVLGLPCLLLLMLLRGPRNLALLRCYVALGLGIAAGLTVFIYIPVRAAAQPYSNWGDAASWQQFRWLVTAAQYHHLAGLTPDESWLGRLVESLQILSDNVRWVGWLPIAWGMVHLWQRQRTLLAYTFGVLCLTVLFHIYYRVEGNPVYLIPAIWVLGLYFSYGIVKFYAQLHHKSRLSLFTIGLSGILIVNGWWIACDQSLRTDDVAIQFAQEALAELPTDAIIFSRDEAATFALWYQQAIGNRPDVAVIDLQLIHFGWYQEHLPRLYPQLGTERLWPSSISVLQQPRYEVQGTFPRFELVHLG